MPKKKYTTEDKKKIIDYFFNNKDNRECKIAEALGYHQHFVSTTISKHLNSIMTKESIT